MASLWRMRRRASLGGQAQALSLPPTSSRLATINTRSGAQGLVSVVDQFRRSALAVLGGLPFWEACHSGRREANEMVARDKPKAGL